jgi:hypothetical protein
MTGRRSAAIALAVIAAGAVAVVLVMFARAGLASSATPAPAPRPTDRTWPFYSASPVPASPVPAAAASIPASASASAASIADSVAPAAPTSPAAAGAAPFVQTFAAQPGVRPQPAKPSPKTTLSMPANVDGCDHAYGTRTQCVPLVFPGGVTTAAGKCAWLAAHGFTDLRVAGADHQKLDPDGNRVACDH